MIDDSFLNLFSYYSLFCSSYVPLVRLMNTDYKNLKNGDYYKV